MSQRYPDINGAQLGQQACSTIVGAFPKCDIFLADEEHHNLPLDETVPLQPIH
jgi:hypothetical protein